MDIIYRLSFLDLVDPDYGEGFVCPTCGPHPDVVIMDGCSVGINRRYIDQVEEASPDSAVLNGRYV